MIVANNDQLRMLEYATFDDVLTDLKDYKEDPDYDLLIREDRRYKVQNREQKWTRYFITAIYKPTDIAVFRGCYYSAGYLFIMERSLIID